MFRNIIVFFLCLLIISCNDVYYNSKGEKFKVFNQRKEPKIIDEEQLKLHPFNLSTFLNPELDSTPSIQYIAPADIMAIAQKTGQLFVIFYNPNCPGGGDYVKIGKVAEERGIPFILIAQVNHPESMKKWYKQFQLKNSNYYILPSTERYGKAVMAKLIPFITELCPACYQQYKDELLDTRYVIIKENGARIKLNLEERVYEPDYAIRWMIKNSR